MQSVIERHNRLSLDDQGLSPIEKFSGTPDDIDPTTFHTWGCPVFILEAANQGTIGTPKWEPRAHTGIYLGHSPCHAGTVALVLNLRTGHVSPQFHVVFDDEFSTVPYLSSTDPPPNWLHLLQHCSEQASLEQTELSQSWLHPQDDPIPSPSTPAPTPTTDIATPPTSTDLDIHISGGG